MVTSVDEIEVPFFRYLAGDLPIKEFEQWLYSTPEIESVLGEAAYFDLVSFSFQRPQANYELAKVIYKYILPGRFHRWQISQLLQRLLDGTQDPVLVFEKLYFLFMDGYYFLRDVGIAYASGIDDVPKVTEKLFWNEGEYVRRRKLLDNYLSLLEEEIKLLLQGLESGEIELTGKGKYQITPELSQQLNSLRQAPIQLSGYQTVLSKKKWWQFWR